MTITARDRYNRHRLSKSRDPVLVSLLMNRRRLQNRPGVEPLEGRALLSTVHASAVPKVPAAYKPPTNVPPKFPPYDITARIDPISDPGVTGNVFRQDVLISGTARPYSTVWLAVGTRPGYFTNISGADSTGKYVFNVPVPVGTTTVQVFAESPAQNYSNVEDVSVTRGNAIVAWDSIALGAFLNQGTSAAQAARDLAIVHAAQYDALANIEFPNSAYQVHLTPPKGASAEAAVDQAAYTVLAAIFPSLQPAFFSAVGASLAGLGPYTTAVKDGQDFGAKVALATLANRANDGANATVTDAPQNVPGLWRPTPPSFAPAVNAQFGRVTPFAISSGSEFRPAAPPAVGSAAYDQALAQVASLGRSNSTTRTADQTASARFWADGVYTSPDHWSRIAESLSISHKDSLAKDARLFAQLDLALADSAIASSDSQYTYNEWRPVSAIQQTDPTWTPLLTTPASPSYVSDSAAYGGAASTVLTSAFGSKVKFTSTVGVNAGPTRSFTSLDAAAVDQASSRVWGGVNFTFDAQAGLTLGNQVGQAVLNRFPKGK